MHKTVKSRGPIEFTLDDEVSAAFSKFVPMVRAAKLKHSYLLSTSRGEQLQRQDMLKLVSNTTEKYLHKKIGIQNTALELQHELGHGPEMQKQYLSRPKGTGRKH